MATGGNKRFNLCSGVAGISLAFAAAFSLPLHAQTLPAGAVIENGQVGINASGANGLIVNQISPNAIISWDRFSIGHGAAVHFENGAGATLNRVRGNISSQIDGKLSATGSLYLINPTGVTIGTSGQVETGGHFFASTLDLSNEDFARASRGESYILRGDSTGSVINLGKVGASGGDIVLAARMVENSGELSAPGGTAALLAGTEILVQDRAADNGQFIVKIGGPDTRATNNGVIQAAQAELRANGGNVYALAGNRDGLIVATGIAAHQGRIFLTAGDNGTVEVSGQVVARQFSENGAVKKGGEIRVSGRNVKIKGALDASSTVHLLLPPMRPDNISGGDGGRVVVTGNEIALDSGSRVDVSGARGGTALIGGDYQGGVDPSRKYIQEDIATARTVSVEDWAIITADGFIGDGGHIVLWADGHTDFSGHISAISFSGQGGDAEVSGKETLRFNGTSNLFGSEGAGTLLLDPYNLTIVAGNGGDVTSSSTVSTLGVDKLTALLAGQNVVVQTGGVVGDGSPDLGDITVNEAISWGTGAAGGTSLTLKAHNNIIVNANITATDLASTITLRADADSTGVGTVTFGGGTYVDASQVAIMYNSAGGYTAPVDYTSHASNLTAYMLVNNVNDLQNIGDGVTGNLAGTYALGQDIDASGIANFMPIGTSAAPFTGVFDGFGHMIKGLTINRPAMDHVGLFGAVSGTGVDIMSLVLARITNVGLEGGSVSGRDNVGALVGSILGDTSIKNVYASSNVIGVNQVGGMVGRSISGGIVQSTISNARAAGVIAATGQNVGGFIGYSAGISIGDAYATGAITGNNIVGGFSGYSAASTIQNIYATGRVTASGTSVGGLVGYLEETGNLFSGFWDIDTTGQISGKFGPGIIMGGFGIYSSTNTVNAFTKATYAGFGFLTTGAWAMIEGQTRPMLRMELDVIGNNGDGTYTISNAHQLQSMAIHAAEGQTLNKTYKLANNINLSSTSNNDSEIWRTVVTKDVNNLYGFSPIGTSAANFRGTFDGNRYGISDLTISQPLSSNIGLFGYTSAESIIRDIGISSGSIQGNLYVGGLAGTNYGAISNTYTNLNLMGNDRVGGLIGRNYASISSVYATGPVGGSNRIGGLIGWSQTGINIDTAYASGAVTASGQYVGGLIGVNYSNISNAYATGSVTGNAAVGGLVGTMQNAVIDKTYATGAVIGNSEAGGFIGRVQTGNTISNSFWNKDATAIGIGSGTGVVTGLTLAQFQNTTYFMNTALGWDFENIWASPGAGHSPELYALSKVIRIHANNSVTATYGSSTGTWVGGVPGATVYGANLNISGETNYGSPDAFSANPGLAFTGLVGTNFVGQVTSLNETGSNGYRFVYTALADITPASLIITASNDTKVYDGNPWLSGSVSYAGFAAGEGESVLSGVLSWGDAYGKIAIGEYVIMPGGLTSSNYNITWVPGVLSITKSSEPDAPLPLVTNGCNIISKKAEVGFIDEGINISAASSLIGGSSDDEMVAVLIGASTGPHNLNCNPDFFE